MRRQFLKKNMAQIIAVFVLVLSIAVPVAAAAGEASVQEARGSTPYVSYNMPLYSGVVAYTSSGACNTRNAAVVMTRVTYNGSATSASVNVATYATSDNSKQSPSTSVSAGATVQLSSASAYPGQSIKAGFVKDNFNGTYQVSGKFYYDGL